MSSTQIEMPARVAMVKPACMSLSAKITVSRSPQRRKDALMSFEISFFLSALLINSKGRPTGRISESRARPTVGLRSEEHTSELQSPCNLVCRLLLEKKKKYE